TEAYGKGFNGRLMLVADTKSPEGLAALGNAAQRAAQDPDVAFASPAQPSPTGDAAIAFVVPKSGPQEVETEHLVHRLRNDAIPPALSGANAHVYVGGLTAVFVDQNSYLL